MIITEISEIQNLIDSNKTDTAMMLKKSKWSIKLMNNTEYFDKLNEYKFNVMHLHKESHISDDVIFTTDHILLTQLSSLHKNDVGGI